jgi:hypothetical protein
MFDVVVPLGSRSRIQIVFSPGPRSVVERSDGTGYWFGSIDS